MEEDKIIEEQIKNVKLEIKNFLVKGLWKTAINDIVQKNNLSSEQRAKLENEVLFVLLSMELASNFRQNIKNVLNLQESAAESISQNIYEKIFKNVENLLPTGYENGTSEKNKGIENSPVSGLGIPSSNLPMVEAGEVAHEVPHVEQIPISQPTPQAVTPPQTPAPEKKSAPPNVTIPDYRYDGGKDPYREPLK